MIKICHFKTNLWDKWDKWDKVNKTFYIKISI